MTKKAHIGEMSLTQCRTPRTYSAHFADFCRTIGAGQFSSILVKGELFIDGPENRHGSGVNV
jgi:hypothetical protein